MRSRVPSKELFLKKIDKLEKLLHENRPSRQYERLERLCRLREEIQNMSDAKWYREKTIKEKYKKLNTIYREMQAEDEVRRKINRRIAIFFNGVIALVVASYYVTTSKGTPLRFGMFPMPQPLIQSFGPEWTPYILAICMGTVNFLISIYPIFLFYRYVYCRYVRLDRFFFNHLHNSSEPFVLDIFIDLLFIPVTILGLFCMIMPLSLAGIWIDPFLLPIFTSLLKAISDSGIIPSLLFGSGFVAVYIFATYLAIFQGIVPIGKYLWRRYSSR